MIVLDTNIWIWWVNESPQLTEQVKSSFSLSRVQLLNLTVPIVVESTQLRGFHNDPADQIIVATAKVYDCLLLTADRKILNYSEVKTLK